MESKIREGFIHTASPTQNYVFVVSGNEVFFLHTSNIKMGVDLIAQGRIVRFEVAQQLPGKKHPMAVNAIVMPPAAPDAPVAPASPKVGGLS